MRRPLGLLLVFVALLAPSATVVALTPDQASAAGCSCPVGPYVDPSASDVSITQDGASPNGVYQVVATAGVDSTIRLNVTRASTKATVFSQTVPGNAFWGFSPDDDRFVYHYLSGNADNVFLFSLAGATASLIWTTAQTITTSRIAFSPHGHYLLYETTQGSNETDLKVVDTTTSLARPAYSTHFSFVSPPGSAGDSFGVVGWGFSSDSADSSFVFAFVNAQTTADWNIVHFSAGATGASTGTVVHEETLSVTAAFWQFSPCGDLIAIATQPSQTRVEVRLFDTRRGDVVPNSDQGFDLAAVSFRSALDPEAAGTVDHFVTVGGQDRLLAKLQTAACVLPPSLASMTLIPASVVAGQTVAGKLTLTAPAPNGGAAVSLVTSNTAITLPGSVTVPAGSTNAGFSIQTSSAVTGLTAVTVTAAYGGVLRRATLSIIPNVSVSLSSLSLPPIVRGQDAATGTVVLSGRTPTKLTIALVSSDAQLRVPTSVTVPMGAAVASFPITADINTAGHVTVTATQGAVAHAGVIAEFPARLDYLDTFCPHTVIGGRTATGGLLLDALAGSAGRLIRFTSSDPSVVPAPASLTVSPGHRQANFLLQSNPVTGLRIVTISASDGDARRSASINVTVAGSPLGTGPWRQVCPAGPLPTPRDWASTTYDSARGNVVLFGGEDANSQFRNDTWTWDGSTWTEQQQPGAFPQARYGAAMAFDEAAGIALLYGGQGNGAEYLQDTWAWNGSSWSELSQTSPPGMLFSPMMAYDRATESIVLFGGATNDSSTPESPDTWTWKNGTWSKHVTAVHPHPGDQTNAFEYDPITGAVLLIEGNCELAPTASCDQSRTGGQTWSWDGKTWTALRPKDNPPRAIGAGFAYSTGANRMILFGTNADTWQWDGINWSPLPTPEGAPCARNLEAMSRQPDIGGAMLFGGLGISSDATCQTATDWNDTWLFMPETSSTPPADNPQPTINDIGPSATTAGGPSFTLTVNGDHFVKGSSVQWNGLSRHTTFISNTQLTAAIPASDLAISVDLAVVRVTVSNPGPGGGISTPLPFTISSGKVTAATSVTASPSKTASASALPTLADQAGLAATLINNGDQPAILTVATYTSNPTVVPVFDRGGGFVDLQVSSAAPSAVVRATFYAPSTTTGKPRAALGLRYFNGTGWAPVRSSGGVPPSKDGGGDLANTISAKFDSTSTPPVSALGGTVFGMLVVDTTPPVITPALSGAPNQAGWFNHDVSISWTVDDPESGIASSSGCLPVTLSAETAGRTVTCVASNGAGLEASRSLTVRIDKTPPVTTAIASPTADQTGVNATDVTVSLRAADNRGGSGTDQVHFALAGAQNGSGVVNGSIATISITAPGTTTLTYFATDLAGNQESPNSLIVRIERKAATPPSVGPTPSAGRTPSVGRTPTVVSLAQTGGIDGRLAIGLILLILGFALLPRRSLPVRRASRRGPSQRECP